MNMNKIHITTIAMLAMLLSHVQAQTTSQNYVKTVTMLDASGSNSISAVQYYNGLGYPTVSVANVGGNGETAYSLTTYDGARREACKYLPVSIDKSIKYRTPDEIIKASASAYNGDNTAYSQNHYDALDRVTSIELPGKEWKNNDKRNKSEYLANTDADKVLHYVANPNGKYSLVKPDDKTNPFQYYPANTLTKDVSIDADEKRVETFKDLFGKVILQRTILDGGKNLDTYYVYDEIGQLCYVLSPLYQKNGKKAITAYEYRYDNRGRVVKKFLPGCEYIQYWYDNADRVIAMQDGIMRQKGLYRFTFYDYLGRLAVQGLADCLSIPDGKTIVAKYTGNGGFRDTGYTLSYNPISNATAKSVKIEIVNYYDNYAFSKGKTASYFAGFSDTTKVSQIGNLTGCITLCSNGEYISQIMGYDIKGNLIKSKSCEMGGKTVTTTSKYSFTNKLLSSTSTIDVKYGNSLKINEKIGYNKFNDKKSSDTISVNHGTATSAILKYTYDNLGRLDSVSRPSSSVSYAYEMHGWLKNITTNSFKEDLFYADCPDSTYNCYNGNIGTMRWSNSNYEQIRGYKFVYDNANRLTDALYGERANLDNKVNRYNEVLEYDENGNITSLQRRGLKQDGQYGKIDNLNLNYDGNQLFSVEEDAKDYDYAGSFEYKRAKGTKYMYNENGSLVADKSRKIAYIEYDLNNNPIRIQFTNAYVTKYVYSATGEKLRVIYQTSVYPEDADIVKIGKTKELTPEEINCTETVDYLLGGSLVMRNGKIDKVLFEGGYAQATAANSTTDKFAFYYYNQDHLGNNREVVDAKGVVQQVTNYYPFGAPYADATAIMGAAVQPYKYNGKELDHMHGLNTYDYGARQLDPILCRWDRIDPLCEKYYETTPYAYCENDPVNSIDPDGRSGWKIMLKAAYKVGKSVAKHGVSSLNKAATYADAFSDVTENFQTLTSSESSLSEKLWAGTCLASECLPVSIGDAKDAGKLVNKAVDAAQDVSGAQKTIKATKNNYRRALQKATGKTGKGYEAHHSLPQKHRPEFEETGINIDEPGNVVWRDTKGHRKNNHALTKEWNAFMEKNPTKEQVMRKRDEIELKYFGNKGDTPNN